MPRKGWNALSPDYRKRLEKNGITETDYMGGASIQAARGHANTPERPTQAANFPSYRRERDRLIGLVTSHKQAYFSHSPKWNPRHAAQIFKRKPPALAKLREWAALTREEWISAIRETDSIAYLGYH